MSAALESAKTIQDLTVQDLKRIVQIAVREALREEITSVKVDSRGYLIFPNESEYAAYIETQSEKLPSQIKAVFIDPQGFRVHYSDVEPRTRKERELTNRRGEKTISADVAWETLRKLGVE